MISVEEALNYIDAAKVNLETGKIPLSASLNKILAADVISPINMPPFRQSAVDGYAVCFNGSLTYRLMAEAKAGDAISRSLNSGEAMRIFTGAMVPEGADTIVPQEDIEKENTVIKLTKKIPKQANIRPLGEQVQEGDRVLTTGQKLTPATIGFLAGLGITEVSVFKTPKVSVVVTGNELQKPGTELQKGKIYESNGLMLAMALQNMDVTSINKFSVKDNFTATKDTLNKAMDGSDLMLVSGGISVGDYDFVKQALKENGVEEIFYKVWQKPGKPLWFGKKGNKYVFALPGNPASALTSFYVYVWPLLHKMKGYISGHLPRVKGVSLHDFPNKKGKALFLKAYLNPDQKLEILTGQQSSMLRSFAKSNVLAYIPANRNMIKKGDIITCIKLPE